MVSISADVNNKDMSANAMQMTLLTRKWNRRQTAARNQAQHRQPSESSEPSDKLDQPRQASDHDDTSPEPLQCERETLQEQLDETFHRDFTHLALLGQHWCTSSQPKLIDFPVDLEYSLALAMDNLDEPDDTEELSDTTGSDNPSRDQQCQQHLRSPGEEAPSALPHTVDKNFHVSSLPSPCSVLPSRDKSPLLQRRPGDQGTSDACSSDLNPGKNSYLVPFSCYPFVTTGILWHINQDAVKLLESCGCLHLPRKSLLDEFVRQYFLRVHPTLPLINEQKFWRAYRSSHPIPELSNQLSLFVFQAMLFMACPVR